MADSLFLPAENERLWNRRVDEQVSFLLETLPERITDSPDATLLSAGCGTGRLLRALADETACELVGFDVDREMLTYAREQSDDIRLFQADLREFGSRSVDAIVCMYTTFNYLLSNADVVAALDAFGDALAEDGVVVVDASNFMAHLVDGYEAELTETLDHEDGRIEKHVSHSVDTLDNRWHHEETLRVFEDGELVETHTATHELRYVTAHEFRFAHDRSSLADREAHLATGYGDDDDRLIYAVGVEA